MAKSMITPAAIAEMCHAELAAWLETVFESLGISDESVIVSQRLKRPSEKSDSTGF